MLPASSNWRRESEILVNYEGTANGSSNFGAAKSKCGGDAKAKSQPLRLDAGLFLCFDLAAAASTSRACNRKRGARTVTRCEKRGACYGEKALPFFSFFEKRGRGECVIGFILE
jgi:hypothetical protein